MYEVLDNIEGLSSGVKYLAGGYLDYAESVITDRALPDLYDGLKPVNRRSLVICNEQKSQGYIKSQTLAGAVLDLHPHGDTSVYAAMVLLTNKYKGMAFPLLDGSGAFGNVNSKDKPGAPRYTELRIHKNARKEYFGEIDSVPYVQNYNYTRTEPVVLPVSFPAVLVNATSGIAVGFKSNIPSFNFVDVCNLVKEYLKDGECSTVIAPDFVTGGYYVKNNKELLKIMKAGVGRLKLRGKYVISDKNIEVTDIPYTKTLQGIIAQVNKLETNCIKNAYDGQDFDGGVLFSVECSSKSRVTEAVYKLYKDTDFQYTYSADITVLDNGAPVRIGVWEIIKRWTEWRKDILKKHFSKELEGEKRALRESTAFMTVVNSEERKMELVNLIASQGRKVGEDYIRDNFTREEVPADLIEFVASRSLPSYHTGGKYAGVFANGMTTINSIQHTIDNIEDYIIRDMDRLISEYGEQMQRRTEITNKDFEFSEEEEEKDIKPEKYIDNTTCYYTIKDNFLRKSRYNLSADEAEYTVTGTASSVLIALDNRGRLLRVYCDDIPLTGSDLGTYLPVYFGLDEDEDYKITYLGLMDGKELTLVYKDGFVGNIDTSEWMNNDRRVKVLEKGIAVESAPYLGAVFENKPQVLMVLDSEGRLGVQYMNQLKVKHRTARTRAFTLNNDTHIVSYLCTDANHMIAILSNPEYYLGKMRFLEKEGAFRSTDDVFLEFM